MAPLSRSAKASASRLTRLSGLSHGTNPSKRRILQCEMLSLVMLGLVGVISMALASKMSLSPLVTKMLGVLVALITFDWNIALNMIQRFVQMFVNV